MTESNSDTQEDSGSIDYKDAETLRRLYYDEELSTNDIAELAGVTGGTIRNWMERHGIERRDRYDAAGMKNRVEWANFYVDKDGYEVWQSAYQGTTDRATVHNLLLIAEGEDPHDVYSDGTEGHHRISIPWLNTPCNVELLTVGQHRSHHSRGERHHKSKLSDEDVREIRRLSDQGLNSFEVAERFDVSPSMVRYISRGERWSHVE